VPASTAFQGGCSIPLLATRCFHQGHHLLRSGAMTTPLRDDDIDEFACNIEGGIPAIAPVARYAAGQRQNLSAARCSMEFACHRNFMSMVEVAPPHET